MTHMIHASTGHVERAGDANMEGPAEMQAEMESEPRMRSRTLSESKPRMRSRTRSGSMAEPARKHALEMVRTDGADEGCVTFVLHEEDHTLGNSLRYMIMKSQDVEFCGYSITHPSESKINFRIQTRGERLLHI
ncbi:DNA-directed RNA polymerases I and III subunit RPAC2 [Sinocyclocheilus grahami]|uniref:DNA-directed RNA polymerases I and III subunit RPAC2 n=1 Tax=Sinocyclocheilus grahami TaxID=75366 RepID=UPI0007AD12C9|nr:PREDICTED: DNA-directed RNA polymerases I and III subunit RPAC2-like [Sinocyclocheilus grahami]